MPAISGSAIVSRMAMRSLGLDAGPVGSWRVSPGLPELRRVDRNPIDEFGRFSVAEEALVFEGGRTRFRLTPASIERIDVPRGMMDAAIRPRVSIRLVRPLGGISTLDVKIADAFTFVGVARRGRCLGRAVERWCQESRIRHVDPITYGGVHGP